MENKHTYTTKKSTAAKRRLRKDVIQCHATFLQVFQISREFRAFRKRIVEYHDHPSLG